MIRRQLGDSALQVSALGLGCNSLGLVSPSQSQELLALAVDSGVNFFDTADVYAEGASEMTLGAALHGVRNNVVIATKFGHPRSVADGLRPGSRIYIGQAIDNSLKRLRTHWVDLYYMHFPDPQTPIDETLDALGRLVEQGKIRYIGLSNFPVGLMHRALESAAAITSARIVCVQSQYNLMCRTAEADVLPVLAKRNVGFVPSFPLASGLLTGKYTPDYRSMRTPVRERAVAGFRERFLEKADWAQLMHLNTVCDQLGCRMSQYAIAWLLNNRSVSSVIAGATSAQQLEENLGSLAVRLEPSPLNA